MNSLCPQPPDWRLDWATVDATYSWIRDMKECQQDPEHHAEGDVWEHVRRVCGAMTGAVWWRGLPAEDREDFFFAALLHDVAKPKTTTVDQGRITSPRHGPKGAQMARRILWEDGMQFKRRERIVNLVRYHQRPFRFLDAADPIRYVIEASQVVRCADLALLAEVDDAGRECKTGNVQKDTVRLFREFCEENACLDGPRQFASAHGRFRYFRGEWRMPDVAPHEEFRCDVVLMSGLPGAGKDHWIAGNLPGWPVVSPDVVRRNLGITPSANQGRVVEKTREQVREFLRARTSFVWNATNVTRQMRDQAIRLLDDYNARIRIVYVEVPPGRLFAQNTSREARVPEHVMQRLIDKLEVPLPYEGHEVEYSVGIP